MLRAALRRKDARSRQLRVPAIADEQGPLKAMVLGLIWSESVMLATAAPRRNGERIVKS